MLKLTLDNLDKVGLILNIIGTLLLAFSFGTTKEGPMTGTENGKFLKVSHLTRPWFFRVGVGILLFGFIVQFISAPSVFEKRKVCYNDSDKNQFVFYSPEFDSCVEYSCFYEKMNPNEWVDPLEITPGCEINDFYTNKSYKAFGCSNGKECNDKIEQYK